jgi:hypothetical protein
MVRKILAPEELSLWFFKKNPGSSGTEPMVRKILAPEELSLWLEKNPSN